MRKRLGIARVLAPIPDPLFITNEPTKALSVGDIMCTIERVNLSVPFIIVGQTTNFYEIIFPSMCLADDLIKLGPCLIKNSCYIDQNCRRSMRNMTKYQRLKIRADVQSDMLELQKQPPSELYRISRIYKADVTEKMYLSIKGRIHSGIDLPNLRMSPIA